MHLLVWQSYKARPLLLATMTHLHGPKVGTTGGRTRYVTRAEDPHSQHVSFTSLGRVRVKNMGK